MNHLKKFSHYYLEFSFLAIAFICMMTFAIVQPFGEGPDEINRYKVVEFIYENGTIPVGDDPAIILDGYGASYAFQPILTYIIEGYLLRAVSVFTTAFSVQLLIARFVNVVFGVIMAVYVRKIAKILFENPLTGWLFSIAIVYLPQNIFMHTYVNTDSMAFMSISMMIYACLLGMKNQFETKTCIHMAIGIILCALSYYNAYGMILCCILIFTLSYLHFHPCRFHWKPFLKQGSLIAIVVLAGISWWFIRNGILYDGDILALDARQECAALTGLAEYNPLTRETYLSQGIPVLEMIFGTDYFTLVWKSFIAMFGPMSIPTHHYIYMSFKYLFFMGILGIVLWIFFTIFSSFQKENTSLCDGNSILPTYSFGEKLYFNGAMILAILIPAGLAIYYSYTWEFQPQGRYFHPILIPLVYFLAVGISRIIHLVTSCIALLLPTNLKKYATLPSFVVYGFLYLFLIAALLYSTFCIMVPYYAGV
ncbi:MAG: hypothetical protein R3Y24_08200 [Eubacteriales bacterium]